jgi:RND family efflux transporter MFP subunit
VLIQMRVKPQAEPLQPERVAPLVSTVQVARERVQLIVTAQGSVEPRTEIDLVTEVAGRIVWVSPQLASGGFFDEGEPLLRIEPRDYEIALEGARASLARAESNLSHAKRTLERQRSIQETGASSRSRLDDAVFAAASADATMREARVAVQRAELDLERTELVAPFAGRVREKRVDVGQFVGRGVSAARIFAVDFAEVRLPIDDTDLAFLSLETKPHEDVESPDAASPVMAHVTFRAEFAGEEHAWPGYIVRTEGALDERTRMVTVVARVDDPYGLAGDRSRVALPMGLFVKAEIEGREVDDVFVLPPGVLRGGEVLLVADSNDRLRVRPVDVLRVERDRTLVSGGLSPGERVIVTPLEVITDGMAVRVTQRAAAQTAADGPAEAATGDRRAPGHGSRWAS